MWVRWHRAPKVCRNIKREDWTPKQRFYWNASFARYSKTKDGEKTSEILKNMGPEIGYIDNFKVYT